MILGELKVLVACKTTLMNLTNETNFLRRYSSCPTNYLISKIDVFK